MAAPESITLNDLTGKYLLNKTLSDNTDAVLSFQGIGWVTRKAIGFSPITLLVKQYKDDAGVVHIDIDQLLTGGVKGTTEKRTANNSTSEHEDHVFGKVRGRSYFAPLSEVTKGAADGTYDAEDVKWLTEGWGAEQEKPGQEIFVSYVERQDGEWVAWATWGFEVKDGKRRYARHQLVRKPKSKESKRIKMYYDYLGPLDA